MSETPSGREPARIAGIRLAAEKGATAPGDTLWLLDEHNTLQSALREQGATLAQVEADLQQRIAARERAFSGFGHALAEGKCRCPYCIGDAEALAEMAANYELDLFGERQKREVAEAQCREQGAKLEAAERRIDELEAVREEAFKAGCRWNAALSSSPASPQQEGQ